jgi:5-methylcytosine-specific restriction protein A
MCGHAALDNGYCDKHQQYRIMLEQHRARLGAREVQRPTISRSWQKLYQTARWRKKRAEHIKAYPNCQLCGSTAGPMSVHHVFPHHGNEAIFWSSPLLTLCKSCHSRITLEEQRSGKERQDAYGR